MKWYYSFTTYIIVSLGVLSNTYGQQLKLKTGTYTAQLAISNTKNLPVHLTVEKKSKKTILVIHNDCERIELIPTKKIGDTLYLPFPDYDSELVVITKNKKILRGKWVNHNKNGNYTIPFSASHNSENVTNTSIPQVDISGRWETYFSEEKEAAVGIIKQNGTILTGTFLTETGDYRYLEGRISDHSFYLSAFDGTHAFILSGIATDSTLKGNFYSGKHYSTFYTASRNDTFELRNPDSITVKKTIENTFTFSLQNLEKETFTFPNKETLNKVVIVQLMGTWCPNCMDETVFYKELYDKYHDQGLEIISIGYEVGETFEEQRDKIKKLKERRKLDFIFLVGGKANKALASEQFNMLNEVISFPTSIYIGKDGEIKRIHTGFNGPGTGVYYEEYKAKTIALVEELLAK